MTLQVISRCAKSEWIVAKAAQAIVTVRTKESPVQTGRMAVVNGEFLRSVLTFHISDHCLWTLADSAGAVLGFQQLFIQAIANVVSFVQVSFTTSRCPCLIRKTISPFSLVCRSNRLQGLWWPTSWIEDQVLYPVVIRPVSRWTEILRRLSAVMIDPHRMVQRNTVMSSDLDVTLQDRRTGMNRVPMAGNLPNHCASHFLWLPPAKGERFVRVVSIERLNGGLIEFHGLPVAVCGGGVNVK